MSRHASALARALRRVPRAGWLCAIVAGLSAACWSIVSPPFQVPDEQDHYAYVKQLAETGRLPSSDFEISSPELVLTLIGLRYNEVRNQPRNHTISSQAQEGELNRDLAMIREQPAQRASGAAGVAASEPPLYYALEVGPYSLAGTVLGRLALMRLLSALMAAVTALFAFLFVREALPRAPWAWAIGGFAVALAPLLGFVSGAVNPDAMLFAVSAALYYLLARAFRRGLTRRLAIALGAVLALGLLTKLNFIGLVPGALLGVLIVGRRAARTSRGTAIRSVALACCVAAAPAVLYALVNAVSGHRVLGEVSGASARTHLSLHEISYIWQLYLPRLPGMANDFPGLFTARQLWFDGFVGRYGWLDTTFPGWVYAVALIPAAAIAALCARELVAKRGALSRRRGELTVYALMAIGVMAQVGAASYIGFPAKSAEFAQARYLLPMLPLLAAVVALAARGAGRRLGPAVGALIVLVFLAHDIFSQLLVVSRFYG
ncbi:MAG TPA: DUF2142 domain-containing protein [Solirubrobacteraceae bacterium]|nr:DUF2142 domain-containing protein [Solirubrobacteraceae bacterium]